MGTGNDAAAPALVADIGGTNARFALASGETGGRPRLASVREFPTQQFGSLAQAVSHYLAQAAVPRPRRAVIAVASAVTGDEVKITNNPWSFSIAGLQGELELEAIDVINDFAAIALAAPHLLASELEPIGAVPAPPTRGPQRRYAVLGPGTGLGVCTLLAGPAGAIAIESEGGHVAFAPGTAYEVAILQHLMKQHARVSVERLLSGPGLHNLYAAVCAVEGVPAAADTPEAITAGAQPGRDEVCRRAVELFCSMLGSFAGDVTLMVGAWDGVFLGGGLTGRLLPWIRSGQFRSRFEAKGRFGALMRTVPTFAIAHDQPGLLGAGARALEAAA